MTARFTGRLLAIDVEEGRGEAKLRATARARDVRPPRPARGSETGDLAGGVAMSPRSGAGSLLLLLSDLTPRRRRNMGGIGTRN